MARFNLRGKGNMDYNATDRWALISILHICPRHGQPLQPVAFVEAVWGCALCRETWHLPPEQPGRGLAKRGDKQ